MIARLIIVEMLKLRGSLAALLMVIAPGMIGALCFLAPLAADTPPAWGQLLEMAFTLWAFFMLPMATTALTTLVSQIEYKPKAWDHVLSLPVRRWEVYAAKAVVVVGAVALMTALMFVFAWLGATLGGLLAPANAPRGEFPWEVVGEAGVKMFAASLLLVMLLLWTALRFASFVVPLATGIGAALVGLAVMVTKTRKGDFFPTLLPVNSVQKPDPEPYIALGAIGGAVVLLLMVIDLSRREMR